MRAFCRRATLLGAVALCLGAADAVGAWEGARWRHLERPSSPAVARQVQVPRLGYEAIAPESDADGRVWLHHKDGRVRVLRPYVGETDERWRVPNGLEAPSLPADDGSRFAVDRDGVLVRLLPEQPEAVSVATGLGPAWGHPCRTVGQFLWPDIHGGVAVTTHDGRILTRFSGEVYRQRRARGGAAVACRGSEAWLALSGGKLAMIADGQVRWARVPDTLAGADFADRLVIHDDRIIGCTRTERACFAVDAQTGALLGSTTLGSYDGPVAVPGADRWWVAGRDGRAVEFGADLVVRREVSTGPDGGWLLVPTEGAATPEVAWLLNVRGQLMRVDWADGRSDRAFTLTSGATSGGAVLHDGTAVLLSNFGSLVVLELK